MKKLLHNRVFQSWTGMTIGSLIYCFAIVFILDKGSFYTGGITGICQIIANDIFHKPILKSVFVALTNIPLFLIGFKRVSKRFAILSLASVILQTIALALFQIIFDKGFDPFANFIYTVRDVDGAVHWYGQATLAVIGGALTGLGCGISLKYGASTGGTDIVSQAFSFKTGFPFVYISVIIDVCVILLGVLVNGGDVSIGIYTLIRLLVANITLDAIYKIYNYHKITVITKHPEEIRLAMLAHFDHGITIWECKGGYSGETRYALESVCLSYELETYREFIKEIDPKAFVYYSAIKGIQGKFIRRAIS